MNTPDNGPTPPSLIPGMVLLALAAVLIVVVLVNPTMDTWLRVTIGIAAILTVLALLGFAFKLFRHSMQGGKR